jgi:SNF2 family DNA or RNA helicase
MSAKQEEEALKNFFESALEPEKDDDTPEEEDKSGAVEGLKVTLMKHQIEGLEFLLDHEFLEEIKSKEKGKGKYGGILADDVPPFHPILTVM